MKLGDKPDGVHDADGAELDTDADADKLGKEKDIDVEFE